MFCYRNMGVLSLCITTSSIFLLTEAGLTYFRHNDDGVVAFPYEKISHGRRSNIDRATDDKESSHSEHVDQRHPHRAHSVRRSDLLVNYHGRQNSDQLFEDPLFPADDGGLFIDPHLDCSEQGLWCQKEYFKIIYDLDVDEDPIVWLRPHELCDVMGWDTPKFVVDDFSIFDINQGRFGDCWFLAATSHLPRYPNLLNHVISPRQDFDTNYNGKFLFKLWSDGWWVEVDVDDRLPCQTKDGEVVGLLGASNPLQPNEFWVALLEKAYAKLHGTYEHNHGGFPQMASVDTTGGVTWNTYGGEQVIFTELAKANRRQWLLFTGTGYFDEEESARLGLVKYHAYPVTGATQVRDMNGQVHQLLKLRNPYGSEPNNGMDIEWTGAWSDDSSEWALLPTSVRDKMLKQDNHDGQFWINFEDFMTYFGLYEECRVMESSVMPHLGYGWRLHNFFGEWTSEVFMRGAYSSNTTANDVFWANPTYALTISQTRLQVSNGDEDSNVVFSLIKSHYQEFLRGEEEFMYKSSVDIFRLDDDVTDLKSLSPVDLPSLVQHLPELTFASSGGQREADVHKLLDPGTYVIIPSATCEMCSSDHAPLDYSFRVFVRSDVDVTASRLFDEN